MTFAFDENIAAEYGVNEAIMLNEISLWVKLNTANKRNYYEDRYWTYNSITALNEVFHFWSRETIKRVLSHLKDEGLILTSSFSDDKFKRVNYYTLSDLGMELMWKTHTRLAQNEPDSRLKMSNTSDSNTNIYIDNTVNTSDNTVVASPVLSPTEKIDLLFEEFWKAYPNRRKYNKPGCKAKYRHIPDIEKTHPDIMAALEVHKRSNDWTRDNGQYIPSPYTYLNQERWKLVDTRTELEIKIDEVAKANIDKFLL